MLRTAFHALAYRVTRFCAKCLFGGVTRRQVVGREHVDRPGGFLLAANHISHFDPPIIATVIRRKVDWMAMAEFYPVPVLGHVLRAIETFPADRDRADRATIRTALDRLHRGRIVGMFPEGGIRDGARSVLEGAPLRPGVATLAHLAEVSVVPCVILGSDRLYSKKRWLPFRRTPIWIGFGEAIPHFPGLEKHAARSRIEQELAASFQKLTGQLREHFQLLPNDLPQPPWQRMQEE